MKSDGGGSGWGATKRRDSNWCGRELSAVESGRIQLPGRREQPSGMRAGPVGVDCGFPNGMFVPSTPLAATVHISSLLPLCGIPRMISFANTKSLPVTRGAPDGKLATRRASHKGTTPIRQF